MLFFFWSWCSDHSRITWEWLCTRIMTKAIQVLEKHLKCSIPLPKRWIGSCRCSSILFKDSSCKLFLFSVSELLFLNILMCIPVVIGSWTGSDSKRNAKVLAGHASGCQAKEDRWSNSTKGLTTTLPSACKMMFQLQDKIFYYYWCEHYRVRIQLYPYIPCTR